MSPFVGSASLVRHIVYLISLQQELYGFCMICPLVIVVSFLPVVNQVSLVCHQELMFAPCSAVELEFALTVKVGGAPVALVPPSARSKHLKMYEVSA